MYLTPVMVRKVDHFGCVCITAFTSGRARYISEWMWNSSGGSLALHQFAVEIDRDDVVDRQAQRTEAPELM